MNIDDWNKGREKWSPVIGRLLLAFGEIEYCMMVCLCPLDFNRSWDTLKHSSFKKKGTESIKILKERHENDFRIKQAIRLINKSMKLVSYRNLVAHNPLNISFSENNGDMEFHLIIRSLRNNEVFITLQKLNNIAVLSEKIATELHNIVNDVWTSE